MTKQRATLTYDTIKAYLRSGLSEVQDELSSPILFGHVCKGDLTRPGALRCSAILSTPDGAATATRTLTSAVPSADERVFQEHIEMAGRDQTFLDWVSLWALGATASNGPASRVPLQSCVTCKVISSDSPMTLSVSGRNCTLELSATLVHELAPQELVTSYLDRLYEWAEHSPAGRWEPADLGWVHDRLRAAQVQGVLSCMKHEGSMAAARALTLPYAKSTSSSSQTEIDEQPALLRRFLGSLQFALLYLRRHYEGALLQSGFVSLAIVALEADSGDDSTEVSRWRSPVAVMSVPFNQEHDAAQVAQTVLRKLNAGSLRSILHDLHQHPLEIADSTSCDIRNSAVRQRMRDAVLAAFPEPAFGDWPIESALWMAELARLSLKFKHEGRRLSFTFVLGDATQMVDSGHFECVPLMSRDFKYPPGRTLEVIDIDQIALMVRRELAEENYCWFLGGRYALMWDATFPSLHPTHLVRFRDSSWELFTAACRSGKPPTSAKYAVVVSYSMGGVGGGMVVDGKHAFVLSKDEQWQVRGAELESRLREYLDATAVAINAGQKERLSQALSAVSTDPDRGCILVVSTSRSTPTFELMGRPWQIDRRGSRAALSTDHAYELDNIDVDELVALLAMDGAGVVWLDDHGKTRIAFRQLVSAPNPARRALSNEARHSLIGKGSRRWSASLVATRDDVPLVVAVSQDGPVYVASARTIHRHVLAASNGVMSPELADKVDVVQIDDPGAVAAWRKQMASL